MKSNNTNQSLLVQSNLLLLILTVFFLLTGAVSYAQTTTVYVYEVEVSDVYSDKDLLDFVAPVNQFSYRGITDNGFRFSSMTPVPVAEIDARFKEREIPHGEIKTYKDQIPLISVDKAGGKDCELAQILCSNSSQSANSNGRGIDELNSNNRGCLNGDEHQSSWYYLNVQTGGALTFEINPQDNDDDYDFALWGPFNSVTANANCPPIHHPLRCNYSRFSGNTGLSTSAANESEGQNGNRYSKSVNATAGQIYILLVDNYSNSGDPYSLSFDGTAVLGCTPIVLPVEVSNFSGFGSANINVLQWTTQSEHDAEKFMIERTTDPLQDSWDVIAEAAAAGNSQTAKNYSLADKNPDLKKVNYYRLAQIDNDGTVYRHQQIVAIDNRVPSEKPVKIFNLMGQEVSAETSGLLIYQFANGTTLKVLH